MANQQASHCSNATSEEKSSMLKCLSLTFTVQLTTEFGMMCRPEAAWNANIRTINNPYFTEGLYPIQPNNSGKAYASLFNCAPYEIEIGQNKYVAVIENVKYCDYEEVNPAYINTFDARHNAKSTLLLESKRKFII